MTKGPILQKIWGTLPKNRKNKIKDRATERIRKYHTLQEARRMQDSEDIYLAKKRLNDLRAGRSTTVSLKDVMSKYGMGN